VAALRRLPADGNAGVGSPLMAADGAFSLSRRRSLHPEPHSLSRRRSLQPEPQTEPQCEAQTELRPSLSQACVYGLRPTPA
jgi:hypothetical protein